VFLMHATFCINSLAHYWGDGNFSDQRSPRDSYLVSLITFGEGYHNFHHEFPYDYRNGVKYHYYDPGKWLISLCSWVGLAYNLKRFPENEIRKGEFQMALKEVEKRRSSIKWGPAADSLPEYSVEDVKDAVQTGASLVIINGFVHDVAEFLHVHPGGAKMIQTYLGADATSAFNGGVYKHSFSANNLLSMMRVGVVKGAQPVTTNTLTWLPPAASNAGVVEKDKVE